MKPNKPFISEQDFKSLLRKRELGLTSDAEEHFLDAWENAIDLSTDDVTKNMNPEELDSLQHDMQAAISARIAASNQTRTYFVLRHWQKFAAAAVLLLTTGLILNLDRFAGGETIKTISTVTAPVKAEPNNLIQLPDGSTVILTPGSKLEVADNFEKSDKRVVHLTGEAYFEVVSNPQKPFIVYAGKIRTTVLGTAFNVRAYSDRKSILVTVTKGKVRIDNQDRQLAVLTPNQQIEYIVAKNAAQIEQVDARKETEWIEEDLFFDDLPLETSVKILEERFGYRVRIEDETLKQKRFTATFRKQQPFLNIIRSISEFNDAKFRIDSSTKVVNIQPLNVR